MKLPVGPTVLVKEALIVENAKEQSPHKPSRISLQYKDCRSRRAALVFFVILPLSLIDTKKRQFLFKVR